MTRNTYPRGTGQPYPASIIDRFNDWVQRGPLPAGIFFVLVGLALIVIQLLTFWLEGGLPVGELLPVIIFNSLFAPFLVGLMLLLDCQARSALQMIRPVLNTKQTDFNQFEYLLTKMPFWTSLIAGSIMLILVILMERLWITPLRYAPLEQLTVFPIVFQIVDKSSAFFFGVFIYHTIRQLRLVNTILRHHVHIDLFNLGPVQAFSRLTATTAIGLVIGVYGWLLINPDLVSDPLIFAVVGIITLLAATVFVLPLYGLHRILEAEKENRLQGLDFQFATLFTEFNDRLQNDDFIALEKLNGTIASLEIQYNRIKAIPTWPWRPEIANFTFTAIMIPLILAILQFLIEQALN